MRKRQQSFDVMKGIACIAVVFIHYNFLGELGQVVKACCRFAVPLFFMISGYFYRREKVLESTWKLLKILVCATVFYGVFFYCWEAVFAHGRWMTWPAFAAKYLSEDLLVKFVISNTVFFNPTLWFVAALFLCHLTVAYLAREEGALRRLCWLFLPLLVVMCVCQEFAKVAGFSWNYVPLLGPGEKKVMFVFSGSYLFRAMPFFLFGIWVRFRQESLREVAWLGAALPVLAVAGCLLAPLEYWSLGSRVAQFYLGSYLTAGALFIWAIVKPQLNWRLLAYLGGELSLLVYILQLSAGKIMDVVARDFHWLGKPAYQYGRSTLVLSLTLLLSFVAHVAFRRLRCWMDSVKDRVPASGKVEE